MATQFPCIKNGAAGFTFGIGLIDQSNTKLLKANPTLASGDFKISIDGGAFANLNTLPTVTPAAGRQVQIVLSQAETNGDNLFIQCVDAAGAEWCDTWINIQTTARHLDDLAFPATSGRSMVVDASGLVDANAVKVGPTGSGTAQTAKDLGGTLGSPAGASVSADIAAAKTDTAAIKTQTDKLTFTVANQIDANVLDWKSATAPAMTGDAFARLGAPAGASVSADVAAIKVDTAAVKAKTDNLPAAPAAVSDIPTAVANADALLGRNIAGGSSAGRTVKQALRFLRNKWTIAAGTLTVFQEDDSTSDWTATVSTDAAAVPIVGNDPA